MEYCIVHTSVSDTVVIIAIIAIIAMVLITIRIRGGCRVNSIRDGKRIGIRSANHHLEQPM
jgi:hypothetical protein